MCRPRSRRQSRSRTGRFIALTVAAAAGILSQPALAARPATTSPDAAFAAAKADLIARQAAVLDHAAFTGLAFGQRTILSLPITTTDEAVLELERFSVLAPGAEVVVEDENGRRPADLGNLVLLRGTVAGDADSMVFIALSDLGTQGFIQRAGSLHAISTGPYAGAPALAEDVRIADALDLAAAANPAVPVPETCGLNRFAERFADGWVAQDELADSVDTQAAASRMTPPCRVAQIAIETDWEFSSRLFGGNADAAASYAVTLMGAISEIYERDFNVRLRVPFVRAWSSNSDPYNTSDDPLQQVGTWWNANMRDVSRTTVHYLTGRQNTSYGGVAYLGSLCSGQGYGVSAYLEGSFPYPLQDNRSGNWDIVVAAHELGHNFGTGHTHDSFEPRIDNCGNGNCAGAQNGTIMSYCHTCSGGITNIRLGFHERVIERVLGYLDGRENRCPMIAGEGEARDDRVTIGEEEESAKLIDVLANDEDLSCEVITLNIIGADSVSAAGGSVDVLNPAQSGFGRDGIRYTAPHGFVGEDTFTYSVNSPNGTSTAVVTVSVGGAKPADYEGFTIPGLTASYYVTPPLAVFLPNYDNLSPFATEDVSQINFPAGGAFAGSGLETNVGARFAGLFFADEGGRYTFTTESTRASKLELGDRSVVTNIGSSAVLTKSGSITLAPGWHDLKVDVWGNTGGAGIVVSYTTPSGESGLIPAEAFGRASAGPACPADLAVPYGVLNFADVQAFLGAFGTGQPEADLATPAGVFNFADVQAFLGSFGSGCGAPPVN